MRINSSYKAVVCSRAGHVILLLAVLFLFPSVSRADVVNVDCTGGDPYAFTSITAALNSLPVNSPTEPHTIRVTGTCTENVNIRNRQRITIEAPAGQTATITSALPPQNWVVVVMISGSHAITLRRLVIRDANVGLHISRGSEVTVENSTVTNNDRLGIYAEGAMVNINGSTTIENNGTAMSMISGQLTVNGNQGENIFRNNGGGILLRSVSANFTGQNTIQNNFVTGVQLSAANATFNQFVLPDGTFRVTTIEGHGTSGVTVVGTSSAIFSGHHIIRNNGGGPISSSWAGVRVFNNSVFQIQNGVEITGSLGPGIIADLHASVVIVNPVTITGNSEEAIRLSLLSGAKLLPSTLPPTPSLLPNVISSITCDSTSALAGDLTGVGAIDCKNVEMEKKKKK